MLMAIDGRAIPLISCPLRPVSQIARLVSRLDLLAPLGLQQTLWTLYHLRHSTRVLPSLLVNPFQAPFFVHIVQERRCFLFSARRSRAFDPRPYPNWPRAEIARSINCARHARLTCALMPTFVAIIAARPNVVVRNNTPVRADLWPPFRHCLDF